MKAMQQKTSTKEYTLDPTNWNEFKHLAHKMVDDMLDHLSGLDEKPCWKEMPDSVRNSFKEELPRHGQSAESVYEEFVKNILPYPNGNLHPRYWGWVQGTGTPLAMMADMLASGLNPHMAGFNQAPARVEEQVIEWLRQMMDMPEGTTGLLVNGGMMANILGLAVARHQKCGFDVRENGLMNCPQMLTVYASKETHSWLKKGCQFLGLGNRTIRIVPTNADYQMDPEALRETIAADIQSGFRPICIVATAGTVNTGAVDDLEAIGAIAKEFQLWFHIDGAFGAFARLSDEVRHLVRGLNQADSLGFDLHKWMYMPFEVACVLVRDGKAHRDAFSMRASYIDETERGVIAGGLPFADLGLELTRNFKALKVWMSLKAHGIEKFSELITQNIRQARHLTSLVEQLPELELLAPTTLNVVCFRFRGIDNEELLLRLQEAGIAVASSTTLDGKFAIRVAIVNHRTKLSDIEKFVESCILIGRQIERG